MRSPTPPRAKPEQQGFESEQGVGPCAAAAGARFKPKTNLHSGPLGQPLRQLQMPASKRTAFNAQIDLHASIFMSARPSLT